MIVVFGILASVYFLVVNYFRVIRVDIREKAPLLMTSDLNPCFGEKCGDTSVGWCCRCLLAEAFIFFVDV